MASTTQTFPTNRAWFAGRIVTVGAPCTMPAGEPGHHTSEGRIADCLLREADNG